MAQLVIDSHQHFWDLGRFEYPWMTSKLVPLHRNFLPSDLSPLMARAGVDRTVVVQAHPSLAESRWLLGLAKENEFIAGAVVWVDLTRSELEKDLDELQSHSRFKGVRHLIENEPDDAWMIRQDALRGFAELERRNLPYDLLVWPRHLKYVPILRDRCPRLKLVVDHIAKPPIAQGKLDAWARDLETVAGLPNIWCKLSGLVTQADWNTVTANDLRPYIRHAIAVFGYERVMFGSDWPVCTLARTYQPVVEILREALGPISEEHGAKVWGRNAIDFYRLS